MGRPRSESRSDNAAVEGPAGSRAARLRAWLVGAGARLRVPPAQRALVMLLGRLAALIASAVLAAFYPTLTLVAIAVWLWVLWPVVLRHRRGAVRGRGTAARVQALPVRYHGGHPGLPYAGTGVLRVWPDDGAALLQVRRVSVAFPLHTVQAVTLVDGRVTLHTGYRGWMAGLVGRLLAAGSGRFCGLYRHRDEDLAIVDRSRVVCDLQRQGRPCRLVLSGRHGGGEEIYLEALVMLRPIASWREPAGGSMGAATHSG
jgi:hypothetical protein